MMHPLVFFCLKQGLSNDGFKFVSRLTLVRRMYHLSETIV